MSERILFRPLRAWPHAATPSYRRKRWPAKSTGLTIARALDGVSAQLRLLGCDRTAYIEVDVDEKHIRLDGELRSNATPRSPGCIISVHHPKLGDLRWACDTFKTIQENLRAIAKTIDYLRAVDRYGCVRDQQQFTGFKAIAAEATETLSKAGALAIFEKYSSLRMSAAPSVDELRTVYRSARANAHPDRCGGMRSAWDLVEQAASVLGVAS